jgi:hypothetical protein
MNLLEITLVVMIISMFSVNAFRPLIEDPFETERFKSAYLHHQFLALAFQQTVELDARWGIDLRFNENGNINRPYRIHFTNTDLVALLGTGRLYEQRVLDD